MVRRKAGVRRPQRDDASAVTDWTSEWELLPKDILAQVVAQRSSLCCKVRSVCKAWRQQAIANPVDVDVTVASPEAQDSLAFWLQQQICPLPLAQRAQRKAARDKRLAQLAEQQTASPRDQALPVPESSWPSLEASSFLHHLDALIQHGEVPAELAPYVASYDLSQTEFLAHFCGRATDGNSLLLTNSLAAWADKYIGPGETGAGLLHQAAADLAELVFQEGREAWKDHLSRWGPVMLAHLLPFTQQSAQGSSTSPDAPDVPPSSNTLQALQQPAKSLQSAQAAVQQINLLKIFAWMNYKYLPTQSWPMPVNAELSNSLWQALQTAAVGHLILGEFLTHGFISQLLSLQSSSSTAGLLGLKTLTLHINLFDNALFELDSDGNPFVNGLQALSQLTSLTLICNGEHPTGNKVKHSMYPYTLLHGLPDSIQSLALHNFRQRWNALEPLSDKPNLVNLDLTGSSAFFPEDPQSWTQLQQLKLCSSLIWLSSGLADYGIFSGMTRLTELNLQRCLFGAYAPGRFINTHHLMCDKMSVPPSLVSLNLSTRSVKGLKLTQPLSALTSLTLHSDCNIRDAKPPLSSKPDLRISYNTLNKAYHGEWWDQLKQLRTKCPNHVSLGVEGLYPTGLEVLQLHSENPEPVMITTGKMGNSPKPYPHKAVPNPTAAEQNPALAQQSGLTAKGRTTRLQQHLKCSPLPNLRILEINVSGCLYQLVLTGLRSLTHLTIVQNKPRTAASSSKRHRPAKLPESLLSLDWTNYQREYDVEERLKHLHHLPRLECVGLHGIVDTVPHLPPTVTRLDLSSTIANHWVSYRQLKRWTHLCELVLPSPLPSNDALAVQAQRHLQKHHIQICIKDKDASLPANAGSCLHPAVRGSDAEEMDPFEALLARQDAAVFDDIDNAMQFALLADAAVNAA